MQKLLLTLSPFIILILLTALPKDAISEIKRPVIFIPGIAGSQLTLDDEVVWGKLSSISKLDKIAIDSGPRDPTDGIVATDIIKGVSFLGVEFKKQYSPLMSHLESELKYKLGDDLYVFPYDWRRSNGKNAELLNQFIDNSNLDLTNGIDIIAHSMGGIISKLYIMDNEKDHHVKNLITMGTPFYGSVQMIDTIIRGWGPISFLGGGSDRVRQILLSFPSVYELLPHYERCCVWGRKEEDNRIAFSLMDVDFWKAGNWFQEDESEWLDTLKETLATAKVIHKKLSLPLPSGVKLWTISGTGNLTKFQVYFDPKYITDPDKAIDKYIFTDGDSSVARPIASFGRLDESFPSWSKHGTVFDDETAKRKLRDILIDEGNISPDNISARTLILTTVDGKEIPTIQIDFELDRLQYRPKEPIIATLTVITSASDINAKDVLRLQISSVEGISFEKAQLVKEDAIEFFDFQSSSTKTLTAYQFISHIDVSDIVGLVSVSVADSNLGFHADNALVVEKDTDE